ncbi:sigma-54 dependent transcriptional regulator [Lentimicrobium sp.]|uniref:sigma-54-dependent transcriptional regulator n=1 Tax=Lentimicrobium sp. TaxID=2034841 RepID=UPI002C5355DB|nr:sigma-54 dependent transcriptional regulator [Lentimicrobium sp.]HOP12395.1 sigma-54 dependent transcriptional regulator [Lentimicrobium sp.]HPF64357.1 sigma-54 dependent transcriptional regulator [Lentimicrobium sp.]HPR24738.1 sigma-54 dependent transcriptional regulator [Lentimicrobium sp.]HRW69069.1 sigma-54 dependent transcriptional regulator [Lentimicrobium sp.]
MSTMKLRVLILDDETDFAEELKEFLQLRDFEVYTANTPGEGFESLRRRPYDLMILDIKLPGMSGLDILQQVKKLYPSMEVIMISGHGDMDTVIQAMRDGAIDYLRKPFRHIDIQLSIERTEKYLKLYRRYLEMQDKHSLISSELERMIDRTFIGESRPIRQVLELASTAAKYPNTNVLITGESGTGKEIVARIIHYASEQHNQPFCAVNSSAVTDSLLESEFFGHVKGSFTGAINDKKGYFEVANGGTLFLDEIADMPFALQAKLLRAIEEKKIKRVGGNEEIQVDFRIIAATNHNVENLIESRQFRLDLFHRLNTLTINIPPLRERPEDIEPLLRYFVNYFSAKLNKPLPKINAQLVESLKEYDFPGNVRELRNMIERAMIFCNTQTLSPVDFQLSGSKNGKSARSVVLNLDEQEQNLILQALNECGYNQVLAAKMLGISRDSLIRRMKKFNIRIMKEQD